MKKTRDDLIDEFMEAILRQIYPEFYDDVLPSFDYSHTMVEFDLPKDFIVNAKKGVKIDADLYLH